MSIRYLLAATLLLPLRAEAQRTCSFPAWTDPAAGGLVYPACATDRPARLLLIPRPFHYPEVLRAAGIEPAVDPVVQVIIDSSGKVIPSSITFVPSPNHAGFRNVVLASIQGYRFVPASRDGRPVASTDTIRLRLGKAPPPLIPRDCVDCDHGLEAARQRAIDAGVRESRCLKAITAVMSWDIPDSLAWAFDVAPDCPGATDAAEAAARLAAYHYGAGIGPSHWVEFASEVHSPAAFEFAMEAARRGERSALTILAFQVTGTSVRVADSDSLGWDRRRQTPKRGCGPLRIFARTDTTMVGPPDTAAALRVMALVDSLIAAPGVDDEIKASAWCLGVQLR